MDKSNCEFGKLCKEYKCPPFKKQCLAYVKMEMGFKLSKLGRCKLTEADVKASKAEVGRIYVGHTLKDVVAASVKVLQKDFHKITILNFSQSIEFALQDDPVVPQFLILDLRTKFQGMDKQSQVMESFLQKYEGTGKTIIVLAESWFKYGSR